MACSPRRCASSGGSSASARRSRRRRGRRLRRAPGRRARRRHDDVRRRRLLQARADRRQRPRARRGRRVRRPRPPDDLRRQPRPPRPALRRRAALRRALAAHIDAGALLPGRARGRDPRLRRARVRAARAAARASRRARSTRGCGTAGRTPGYKARPATARGPSSTRRAARGSFDAALPARGSAHARSRARLIAAGRTPRPPELPRSVGGKPRRRTPGDRGDEPWDAAGTCRRGRATSAACVSSSQGSLERDELGARRATAAPAPRAGAPYRADRGVDERRGVVQRAASAASRSVRRRCGRDELRRDRVRQRLRRR